VRLHPVGRCYSVIRTWMTAEKRFRGWYVNLEQPWTRTSVGFDSSDDVLDITLASDLSEWQLKDADELEFAVEVGQFTPREAETIHATAASAVDDIVNRRWPFDEAAWSQALPPQLLELAALPEDWERP